MGFSLRNLVKGAEDDVAGATKRVVALPASTARVVQKSVAQVNPFDNGRTFKNNTPTNNRSVFSQALHNGLTDAVGSAVKPIAQFPLDVGSLGYNKVIAPTFKLPQQNLQKNPILDHFAKSVGANGSIKQTIGSGIETALTPVAPELKGAPLLVKAGAGAGLGSAFGAAGSFGDGGNIKDIAKSAAIGGILGGATPLAPIAGKTVLKGANKALDVVERKPFSNVSDNELAAASRVNNAIQGFPDNTKPGDVETYRKVQSKIGADANDTDAVDQAILQRQAHAVKLQARNQKLQSLPIGLGTSKVDSVATDVQPTKLVPTADIAQPKPTESTAISTKPIQKTALVNDTPKVADNGLTSGAKTNRQNLSDETISQLSGDHTVRNTVQLEQRGNIAANTGNLDDVVNAAHERLAVPSGHISDEDVSFVGKAIERADTEGRPNDAAALHDSLSEHLTAAGQTNQAASILYKRSPQGLFYKATRDLKKAGVNLSDEQRAGIQSNADAIKAADAEVTKHQTALENATSDEDRNAALHNLNKAQEARNQAVGTFHQSVSKLVPQSKANNALSIWKAGLLSGVKTHGGNLVSNGTFALLKKLSDAPSAGVDKAISLVTGKRTKTATLDGSITGAFKGIKEGGKTLKTGIDSRNVADKYEQHAEINLKNPILNKTIGSATRGIFRGMGAADQPFWYSSLKNSLYDQAKAEGVNKGLRGDKLDEYMDKRVQNPSKEMAQTATNEADKSVLNYDTIGSKIVQGAHKAIDNFPGATNAGKSVAHGVLNVLAPFVRVPSAFISRTIDFTPFGVGKEVFHQVAKHEFDQRALSQAIGEGITGTGVIALGITLAQHNLLSGDYPKSDPKEAARWQAEGITPNSVKLGNHWVSLNYLGPVGLLFNAGNQLNSSKGQSGSAKAGATLAGLGQGLLGQSFLQGFTGFSDALNNPQQSAKSYLNSQASSVVPSIVNDFANATDKSQRQTNTVPQAVKNRIPGLRETNPVKTDVYGNALPNPNAGFNQLNPLKPSTSLSNKNPVVAEVSRLSSINPDDKTLQVTPTPVDKSITVDKKVVSLNPTQRQALQKQIGQETQSKWGDLIQTATYKSADDQQKAAMLNNVKSLATEDAQRSYVVANNFGTYSKPESNKAVALRDGTNSVDNLASNSATGGSTSNIAKNASPSTKSFLTKYNAMSTSEKTTAANNQNDFEYQTLQAQYDNNKAQGKLTTAQDIKAQDALAKAKVGSTYSKNIRDLYGLSTDDLYNYVSENPNGKNIANQVIAYGDALANAGVVSKNKFRSSKGDITLADSSTKSTSKSKKSGKLDYAKLLSQSTKSTNALRDLVKKNRIKSRKVSLKSKARKA